MVIYPWKKGWKNNWTFDPGLSGQRLSDEKFYITGGN